MEQLLSVEVKAINQQLTRIVESVLADQLRPGAPAHFSLDQIGEKVAKLL